MRSLLRIGVFGLVLGVLAGNTIAGERVSLLQFGGAPVAWHKSTAADTRDLTLTFAVLPEQATLEAGANCGTLGGVQNLQERSTLHHGAIDEAIAVALGRWQDAAPLGFKRIADPAAADIVIGTQTRPKGIAFVDLETRAVAAGPGQAIRKAFVCLNPEQKWKLGFDGVLTSYDLVHVLTHEFGHVLGLDHPSARGHVMSFKYTETQQGLSNLDRISIQSIYGSRKPRAITLTGAMELRTIANGR